MSLSRKQCKAIEKFSQTTVRSALANAGWKPTGKIDDEYEEFDNNRGILGKFCDTEIYIPEKQYGFEGCDDDFVEIFAEVLDISSDEAIALLSGKQTTTLTWHSPDILPPPNVPLIVDLEGKHRAAEFTGDHLKRLKFCDGSAIVFLNGKWSYKSGGIRAIAWEVNAEDAIAHE